MILSYERMFAIHVRFLSSLQAAFAQIKAEALHAHEHLLRRLNVLATRVAADANEGLHERIDLLRSGLGLRCSLE